MTEGSPQPRDSARVSGFIALVASAAGALLVAFAHPAWETLTDRPVTAATLLGLAFALQLVTIEVYKRGSISFSSTGLLAAGFILGPGPAVLAGLLAGLLNLVRRRGRLDRGIFDAAQFALAAGSAAVVYRALATGDPAAWRSAVAAVLAGGVYLAVNVGLLTAAMSLAEGTAPLVIWQERFRWLTPYHLAAGPLALAAVIAYLDIGVIGVLAFALPPMFMMFSTRQYLTRTESAVEELRASSEQIRKTHLETITALSRAMEAKDRSTGAHTGRVAELALHLARRLGVRGADLDAIEIGALLHDIGKIAVPEAVLNKPGPLDDNEWKVMRGHPLVSDKILSAVDLHPFVRQIARSSHERIDGRGYPDGLAGDAVPLPARIVLVADAFDALTSDRPYRRGRGVTAALDEMRAHRGTQFCPNVIAALEAICREEPELLGAAPMRVLEAA